LINEYLIGDSIEVLQSLPDEIVQTVVTSPPYWGLRTYGEEGQYGLEPTPEEHIERMVNVFREVRRVLRKDGTVWLNYGDSYAGAGYHQEPIKNPDCDYLLNRPNSGNLKPKDLCMIPARVALALQADGWWLRSDIIWSKPNPMPESVTDRPTNAHEHIFLLAKSGTNQYWTHRDLDGVRQQPKPDYRFVHTEGYEQIEEPDNWRTSIIVCPVCNGKLKVDIHGAGIFGDQIIGQAICDNCDHDEEEENGHEGQPKPKRGQVWEWKRRNLWDGHDYFYDADAVREPHTESSYKRAQYGGTGVSSRTKDMVPPGLPEGAQRWSVKELKYDFDKGRNLRNVWTIPTHPYPDAHFATFPPALVKRCVLAGTSHKACEVCGAAWERVVEKVGESNHGDERKRADAPGAEVSQSSVFRTGKIPINETKGFRPTCSCDQKGTGKCLILDPFMGSGTVAEVAQELGRDWIGIDLNPKYKDMAMKRIQGATIGLPI
jgi:site-specific DNA-methyltransferase (adenine-specific)